MTIGSEHKEDNRILSLCKETLKEDDMNKISKGLVSLTTQIGVREQLDEKATKALKRLLAYQRDIERISADAQRIAQELSSRKTRIALASKNVHVQNRQQIMQEVQAIQSAIEKEVAYDEELEQILKTLRASAKKAKKDI